MVTMYNKIKKFKESCCAVENTFYSQYGTQLAF